VLPPVAQVAPQEMPRPAEPTSVPPAAQVAPQEMPRAADTAPPDPDVGEETASSDAHEQLALLRIPPSELTTEKKPLARPVPKPLEGFVIQVGFSERRKAQHWAESMQRRGYAVSVTEAAAGSVRVRVGNFEARDEAERQLQTFRKDGLTGIVINLPQAFRPQVVESQSERP
jgi:cell division protein FtsN